MTDQFLEQFYENVIFPRYKDSVTFGKITWIDHGKVGLDAWAHHFKAEDNREYVLLYEDFPDGSYLNEDLSHEVVKVGNEISIQLKFGDDAEIVNITGWFTLFVEKSPR